MVIFDSYVKLPEGMSIMSVIFSDSVRYSAAWL
jgi:hypothetical protein